jgi:LPXTG-motif cell wall-anchored protein
LHTIGSHRRHYRFLLKKSQQDLDDRKINLMGVLGGGMILATLLGPYATFLAIASVLTVEALFFADGGLLALVLFEGLVTTAVVSFVWKARPEILEYSATSRPLGNLSITKVLTGLGMAAGITGGAVSWFASSFPGRLEWSIEKISGQEKLQAPEEGIHHFLAGLQEKTAFLSDYSFQTNEHEPAAQKKREPAWPVVDTGTMVSGLVAGGLTLIMALAIGFLFRKRSQIM